MKAGIGSRPSHTWRSLLAGRELLSKGLQKFVGDGKTTFIWKDPWIPGVGVREPIHPINDAPIVTMVCELMNEDGTCWDERKLEVVFDAELCRKIRCIPLRRNGQIDSWSWKAEASGLFFVRSCYKLAMEEVWEQIAIIPYLFCAVPNGFWKSISKLPLNSRYKIFLWRACIGIIPSIEALKQRGMHIDEGCIMCGTEMENTYHSLVDCSSLVQIWEEARHDFTARVYHNSLIELLSVDWMRWDQEQRCYFTIALYLMWDRRNKKKFTNEVINLNGLWTRVERCWDELQVARIHEIDECDVPSNLSWEKPKHPFIKVNVDAAVKSSGEGALGGVLRDCYGCVLGAFISSTPVLNDVALIEAMAVEKGMLMAWEAGVKHLIVECDSQLVVNMLNSVCNHASILCGVCMNILDLRFKFNEVVFKWIPRSCNNVADCMSRVAKALSQDRTWSLSSPVVAMPFTIGNFRRFVSYTSSKILALGLLKGVSPNHSCAYSFRVEGNTWHITSSDAPAYSMAALFALRLVDRSIFFLMFAVVDVLCAFVGFIS
ncbi:uncharacterized protein G2W53_042045 [Senna tora]|uniref:RNase H type-1 domain-containing protein n=1 Tax=Senna tora TaxID=362788 RepID=A0A834ST33_9FABA|nr:uncharacterized protein G2W53_042045 [Senna tora]